jgi:hypothetical protein
VQDFVKVGWERKYNMHTLIKPRTKMPGEAQGSVCGDVLEAAWYLEGSPGQGRRRARKRGRERAA